MTNKEREWLEQLIRENKESDNELTYTYCPFSVLYALQQENQQLHNKIDKAIGFIDIYTNGINLEAFDCLKLMYRIKEMLEDDKNVKD